VSRFAYPRLRHLKGDDARRRDAAVIALVERKKRILFKFYPEIGGIIGGLDYGNYTGE